MQNLKSICIPYGFWGYTLAWEDDASTFSLLDGMPIGDSFKMNEFSISVYIRPKEKTFGFQWPDRPCWFWKRILYWVCRTQNFENQTIIEQDMVI